MASERTLGIVKPDAVSRRLAGRILAQIEAAGLEVDGLRLLQLSEAQARTFYKIHEHSPFYESLVRFMSSGPCAVMVLKGDDAISRYRALMGATNPAAAAPNTLRQLHGTDVERNAVHGSDSLESATQEIAFFRAALSRWL